MPEHLTLYLLLVLAVGIGFLLGRLDRRAAPARADGADAGKAAASAAAVPASYYEGLNYLLDERDELAVETLIDELPVTADTTATHLAMGALLRRRGEHEKAIRVHQNLLAAPRLRAEQRQQSNLELARDFLAAGLLGRAETLLKGLPAAGGRDRQAVLRLLLDVYVRERDWQAALPLARDLADSPAGRRDAAHIACELAEEQLTAGEGARAAATLDTARRFGEASGRVALLQGRAALARKDHRGARRALRRALASDRDLVGELLPLYRAASLAINEEADYLAFLRDACSRRDETPVDMSALSEQAQFIERDDGPEAAQRFLVERLVQQPSLAGLIALLELVEERGLPREQLAAVLQYCRTFLAGQPAYRCSNCGFRARQRHWLCPSCRHWGTHRALQEPATSLKPEQTSVRLSPARAKALG
ncbi:MAG: hypothetical protein AAGI15_15420 [Pseudomonadota bacterium]